MVLAQCGTCSFQDADIISASCPVNCSPFMTFLTVLLASNCELSDACNRIGRDPVNEPVEESYDFVVVGAGVAGPIVTTRLAENPNWKILLIEAGPETPTGTSIPSLSMNAIGSKVDWNYKTYPQKSACLNQGGECVWPRGKMMGGTQGLQGMMYTRGSPELYNSWRDKIGNPGWGYDDVFKYFIKSETNRNMDQIEADYHGTDGPLVVQFYSDRPAITEDIIKAGLQIGYRTGDFNGKNQSGIAVAQMMVYENQRGSTERMYLRRNQQKMPNVRVAINSHVSKVLIDDNNVATGIEFIDRHKKKIRVKATKEVILSAGTIGSAQILLLSGVGPKKDLDLLGIKTIQDIPVGRNLHNHVSVGVPYYIDMDQHNLLNYENVYKYLSSHSGPLTSTGMTQLTAFLYSPYTTDETPDIQVFFDGFDAKCSSMGSSKECDDGRMSLNCGKRIVNTRPTNIQPRSRGTLKLHSTDPFDQPLLDPNYFDNEEDLEILVDGIRKISKLTEQEALKNYNFQLATEVTPYCQEYKLGSDDYWKCYIKQKTGPENHQVGTCSMGPSPDKYVVNNKLQVHGVSRLRVIDASIIPIVPNSNPISVITMIAEKGSDLIKESWNKTQ